MVKLKEYTDDKVLWSDIKAGNKSCFNQLFRKYYSELFYYGIKIFPDEDCVKESIQEIFIRIWDTREKLANVENVKSYLIVSVRRMILVQKNKSKHNIDLKQVDRSPFLFEVNEFEKHNEISDEIRNILLAAINSLTRKQRELIMLFFYHELTYPEISNILEISIQATRNLMYRTLIHLRKSIGDESLNSMKNKFFLLFSSVTIKKVE